MAYEGQGRPGKRSRSPYVGSAARWQLGSIVLSKAEIGTRAARWGRWAIASSTAPARIPGSWRWRI